MEARRLGQLEAAVEGGPVPVRGGSGPAALLETKFYVPGPRRGLVPRPRLSERLDHGTASKLMLISAPAGFGKTTLLAGWLAAGPAGPGGERRAAWLSLDERDNDPASFWTYVIAALRMVAAGIGDSALALLQAPRPPPAETVLTALLNDLAAVAGGIVLVLDDYHLIDAREVQDGMAFLLDHLPPRLHVVITSRADPALPLARRLQPARLGMRSPPRQAQSQRRPHQPQRLRASVLISPPGRDPPVGLDPGAEPGRYHHGLEPRPDQGPAQPQPTRPDRVGVFMPTPRLRWRRRGRHG